MKRRKYQSVYVPAAPPRLGFWAWLRQLFRRPQPHTPRRESALPQREFWNEIPQHVWQVRERASEARHLLRRYVEDKPISRRAWVRDGFSESSWTRARRALMAAKVLNREGKMLYSPTDATICLNIYLRSIEYRAWQSGRFVGP